MLTIAALLLAGSFATCTNNEGSNEDDDFMTEDIIVRCEKCYYYCLGEKIFLNQVSNKIFLQFTSDAEQAQMRALVGINESLKLIDGAYCYDGNLRFAALVSKEGKPIESTVLESFKAQAKIAFVTYIYLYEHSYQGLLDVFAVKLKENTTYEQLQKLAEQNNCAIGAEDEFMKNEFYIHISKHYDLSALQIGNLFYETGLFEFVQPKFAILY